MSIRYLLLIVICSIMITSTIYEIASRYESLSGFPVRGRLIDIGGRSIQLDCRGAGQPTVVFEAGLDVNGSLSWDLVQDEIARYTRACTYSRAGILWSDQRGGDPSGKEIATDLHLALAGAGELSPFILVGHSMGGPYSLIYYKYFPTQIGGIVFVDASHTDQLVRFAEIGVRLETQRFQWIQTLAAALSRTSLTRLFLMSLLESSPRQLWRLRHRPRQVAAVVDTFAPKSIAAVEAENSISKSILSEAGGVRLPWRMPIVVITGAQRAPTTVTSYLGWSDSQAIAFYRLWKEMQRDAAGSSGASEYLEVVDAGHYVQFDRPDVVVKAVLATVDRVRGDKSLPAN